MQTGIPLETLRRYARTAGVLYLVIIVCAGFAEGYVRGTLVTPGDAAATAVSISNATLLYRVGFALDLIAFLADTALAVLLALLFLPVSRVGALMAGAFRLGQAIVLGLNLLNHYRVLLLVDGGAYVQAFDAAQTEALVLLALDAHRHGYLISGAFFGVHCLIAGYLTVRAAYLPSWLGGLLALAGAAYLAESFTAFLAPLALPAVAGVIIPIVIAAELSFCGYLLVRGVRPGPGAGTRPARGTTDGP